MKFIVFQAYAVLAYVQGALILTAHYYFRNIILCVRMMYACFFYIWPHKENK